MEYNLSKIKYKLLFCIILTIGFQQFPVIRVGGSLKVYEIIAIAYTFLCFISYDFIKFKGISKYLILFFIVSPFVSYIYSNVALEYPKAFYLKYYEIKDSFKFNYYVYPFLQIIYMIFNGYVIRGISESNTIYLNFSKIIKYSIYIGTIISIYSIFAMFTQDIILLLPEFIQAKRSYVLRSSGFSMEPSFYILYQGWIVLFILYSKKLFKGSYWWIIFAINILSFLFTLSSTLLAFLGALILSYFFVKLSFQKRIKNVILLFITLLIVVIVVFKLDLQDLMERYFIDKIETFLFEENIQTDDSGGFRRYTARIGMKIWENNPLTGCGVGNSVYYMHMYEDKMGILRFGERLHAGSFPQNTFSLVLAEQGILGAFFLFLLIFNVGKIFFRNRNNDKYSKMFFTGFIFNISAMLSIAPVYSLFIWVFIALGLCYFKGKKLNGN